MGIWIPRNHRRASVTNPKQFGVLPEITQIVTTAPDGIASATFAGVDCTGSDGTSASFNLQVNGQPGPGEYIVFGSPTQLYYAWFTVNGFGTDPAPGGQGIQVDTFSGDSTDTIADEISGAINGNGYSTFSAGSEVGAQAFDTGNVTSPPAGSDNISVTSFSDGSPSSTSNYQGAYMTLSTWALSGTTWSRVNYYIWFNAQGESTDPLLSGRTGIEIDFAYGDSYPSIVTEINIALGTNLPTQGKFFFGETGNVSNNFGGDVSGSSGGFNLFADGEGPLAVTVVSYGTTNGLRATDSVTFAVPGTSYYLWFKIAGTGTNPALAGKTPIQVTLLGSETNAAVATAIKAALDAAIPTKISTGISTNTLTLTNLQKGPVTDANKRGTNFTVTVTQQGS